tara:strand:+ start:10131 stop:11039 length:909 start_codon:yes stop_codon:yes gene_type:complete
VAENSKIEWCDHTWNPWIGCTRISPACDHCYAARIDHRFGGGHWGAGAPRKRTSASNWKQPLRWNRQAAERGVRYRVFCASLADVFDNEVPAEWRADLFDLIRATPHLDWLLLTKRIGNAFTMLPCDFSPDAFPNVWLGATVVNQDEADRDIPKLLTINAPVRFLSIEPMLGPIDLRLTVAAPLWAGDGPNARAFNSDRLGLHWIIAGGESGPQARPSHPDWFRSLRDQCAAAGVPFLFKQWGEWVPPRQQRLEDWQSDGVTMTTKFCRLDDGIEMYRVGKTHAGRALDGRTWDQFPQERGL